MAGKGKRAGDRPALDSEAVAAIKARDAGLDSERLAIKYNEMRKSSFAFLRATCHLHYSRLPDLGSLMDAPKAWCCGDLHLENIGCYKAGNGLVYFDINDFDESLLAPCTFDILRACAGLPAAAREAMLPDAASARLMPAFIAAYAAALAGGKADWIERDSAGGPVGALIGGLKGRSRKDFLVSRAPVSSSGKRRIATARGKHALPASKADKTEAKQLVRDWVASSPVARAKGEDFFDVVDSARRVAGLGSLGLARHVVLVRGGGKPDEMRLLDIKLARASCAVAAAGRGQPAWPDEAVRVVAVQEMMQAKSPRWLGTADGFVVRELQPGDDKLDLKTLKRDEPGLQSAVETCARLAASAHLRAAGRRGSANADALIAFGRERNWRAPLLNAAMDSAARSHADWDNFSKAYDAGAFTPGSSAKT